MPTNKQTVGTSGLGFFAYKVHGVKAGITNMKHAADEEADRIRLAAKNVSFYPPEEVPSCLWEQSPCPL